MDFFPIPHLYYLYFSPGLSNVLAQTEKLEDCVHKSQNGFEVLLLSTARFKALVISLSQQYDRVPIDSAPMNAVSDALILALIADSVVYIATADSTPCTLVLNNINMIRYSNLPLTGLVLNKVDGRKQEAYGKDGYYNGYYNSEHS